MINYKKNLLSVAAAVALSTTIASAGYIPLTSDSNDDKWILFGVNGLVNAAGGASSAVAGAFTITDNAANAISDTNTVASDEVAVEGLIVDGQAMVTLKNKVVGTVEIRIDTSDKAYIEYESVRTIYIDTDGSGTSDFSVEYKTSLEGETMEYQLTNGTAGSVYTIVLDDTHTYDNPGKGTPKTGVAVVNPDDVFLSKLETSDDERAIDYDFSNNPVKVDNFVADDHLDAPADAATTYSKFYSYNASTQTWQTFDSRNTDDTNSFDTLVPSKAYWGKVHTATGTTETGMVLGSGTLTSSDYVDAGLAEGWNLLSFDASNTHIRSSSTGMLLQADFGDTDQLTILDSSLNQEITITFDATTSATAITETKHINSQIKQAQVDGTLPLTIDIKAFPIQDAAGLNTMAIVSNKKFSLKDVNLTSISKATTLAGNSLWNESNSSKVADINITATAVTSVYGEYSMIIEPLVGTGTASSLASSASIKLYEGIDPALGGGYETPELILYPAGANTNTQVSAALTAAVKGTIVATEIDLEHGTGTNDHNYVLMASSYPFYISDNTFSRVFQYTGTATATDSAISVTQTGGSALTETIENSHATPTATTIASAVDTAANIGAGALTGAEADKIVFVLDTDGANAFHIMETSDDDYLNATTTTDKLAKGAVQDVLSIDALVKKAVVNIVHYDVNASSFPDGNDSIKFQYVTGLNSEINGTATYLSSVAATTGASTDAENLALFDALEAQITADITALGLDATVDHNYTTAGGAAADLAAGVITITSSDVIDLKTVLTNDPVGTAEVITYALTAGNEDGNDTNITFDGITITLDAANLLSAVPDINESKYIATEYYTQFKVWDDNGTSTWTVTNPADGNVTFTKKIGGEVADTVFGGFVVSEGTADTVSIAGSVVIDVNGTVSTAELNASTTTDLGGLEPEGLLQADLSQDLKYSNVYTPDYVMDGPLFVIREAGYKLQGLVTGSMNLSHGKVAWDSIDLTRPPSEWTDSQDYNLFDTDPAAGYWANLELLADPSNPIGISNPMYSTMNYYHHFDADGSTTNWMAGTFEVTIAGIDYGADNDSAASARVRVSYNGIPMELTRSSGDVYTGAVGTYVTEGISDNTQPTMVVYVSDGLGNKKEYTLDANTEVFKNVKPATPDADVSVDGTSIVIAAEVNASNPAVKYYIYDGDVPEDDYGTTYIGSTVPGTDITGFCASMSAVDFTSSVGEISVVAIDGATATADELSATDATNAFLNSNVSDADSVAFMPILKSRGNIIDLAASTTETATTEMYDTNCTQISDLAYVSSVTLRTITDGRGSKLAYTPLGEDSTQTVPNTVYVRNAVADGDTIVAITYTDDYIGDDVFVSIQGTTGWKTFKYQFPTIAGAEATNSTSADAIDLDALGYELVGVNF